MFDANSVAIMVFASKKRWDPNMKYEHMDGDDKRVHVEKKKDRALKKLQTEWQSKWFVQDEKTLGWWGYSKLARDIHEVY